MPHVRESISDMLESEGKKLVSDRIYRLTTPARLPNRIKEGYTIEVKKVDGSAGEVFTLISKPDVPVPPKPYPSPDQAKSRALRAAAAPKPEPVRKKATRKKAGRKS